MTSFDFSEKPWIETNNELEPVTGKCNALNRSMQNSFRLRIHFSEKRWRYRLTQTLNCVQCRFRKMMAHLQTFAMSWHWLHKTRASRCCDFLTQLKMPVSIFCRETTRNVKKILASVNWKCHQICNFLTRVNQKYPNQIFWPRSVESVVEFAIFWLQIMQKNYRWQETKPWTSQIKILN